MVFLYVSDVTSLPDPAEFPEILNELSSERCKKTLAFRRTSDRKLSLGAGLLLKKVLKIHGFSDAAIRYSDNGKPETDGIYFNLSHSGDYVICTVSEFPVGCDIEKEREVGEKLAQKFLSENEMAYLSQFDSYKKQKEFFRLWTIKESYLKMTGEGISHGLEKFEVLMGESVTVLRENKKCSCSIKEYLLPSYSIAVCSEDSDFTEEPEMIYFD